MKKRTVGIVLTVLGALAFLGSLVNGEAAKFVDGTAQLSDVFALIFTVAFIVVGIVLIVKGKNTKKQKLMQMTPFLLHYMKKDY